MEPAITHTASLNVSAPKRDVRWFKEVGVSGKVHFSGEVKFGMGLERGLGFLKAEMKGRPLPEKEIVWTEA